MNDNANKDPDQGRRGRALQEKEGVTVISVNVLTTKAKEKRRGTKRGRIVGHTTPRRKAIVTRPPARRSNSSQGFPRRPVRTYKPTSPGLRQMTRSTFEEITTKEPHKPLLELQIRGSGRSNQGRVRHRGGGERTSTTRCIDFKRDKTGVPAASRRSSTTEPLGLDRPAPLPRRREALHAPSPPHGLRVGDVVVAGPGCRGAGREGPAAREHPAAHSRSTTSS